MFNSIIALGSNLNSPIDNIKQALQLLNKHQNINIINISNLYKSKAFNLTEENSPDFYNLVCEIQTELTPHELLKYCQFIETSMGRIRRTGQMLSRIIDLDIILYNNQEIHTRELTIPHTEYLKRDFVLTPLGDIYTEYKKYIPEINSHLQDLGRLTIQEK